MNGGDRRIDWQAVRRRLEAGAAVLATGIESDPERRRALIEARTANLARPRQSAARRDAGGLLLLCLGRERYALELKALAGVTRERPLGPVVGGASTLLGTFFEAGEIWAIHDLGGILHAAAGDVATGSGRYLLMRQARPRLGFRVDHVDGLGQLEAATAAGFAAPRPDGAAGPVLGVTPDGVSILDAAVVCGRAQSHGGM
jgi:chemotaxis signal transduction protein